MKPFTNMDTFIMDKDETRNENVLEVTICDLKYQNKSIEELL